MYAKIDYFFSDNDDCFVRKLSSLDCSRLANVCLYL